MRHNLSIGDVFLGGLVAGAAVVGIYRLVERHMELREVTDEVADEINSRDYHRYCDNVIDLDSYRRSV